MQDMAKDTQGKQGEQGEQAQEAPKESQRGKYTVLEQITVQVQPPTPEGSEDAPAPVDTQVFVQRGEVTARSKNDAIRTAFNESKIEGAGTYAAVTSRSFAPVEVKPTVRTALSWS